MADGQGSSQNLLNRWSRIRGQMFSKRRPEDFLKRLDGCNVPSTSTLESKPQVWTRIQSLDSWQGIIPLFRVIRMYNESIDSIHSIDSLADEPENRVRNPPDTMLGRLQRLFCCCCYRFKQRRVDVEPEEVLPESKIQIHVIHPTPRAPPTPEMPKGPLKQDTLKVPERAHNQ